MMTYNTKQVRLFDLEFPWRFSHKYLWITDNDYQTLDRSVDEDTCYTVWLPPRIGCHAGCQDADIIPDMNLRNSVSILSGEAPGAWPPHSPRSFFFHINLHILPYLLFFCILSLKAKVKICRMDIQYYFAEFNLVQKLKLQIEQVSYLDTFLDKIKSGWQ